MSGIFTVDFETYYDHEYSLSKMTTEAYVCDPRFEIMLVGVKFNDRPAQWVSGTKNQIGRLLRSLELHKHGMVAHNTMFDGLILAHHFGIYPKFYFDTLSMAQVLYKPYLRSISLRACLEHANLGLAKGHEVENMLGRTRDSLSPEELRRYGKYCTDDCDGEFALFKHLLPMFPRPELELIDLTLRMYIQPQMKLDARVLAEVHALAESETAQKINQLPAGVLKEDVMSNVKLAEVLQRYGVQLPIKISPTTGETTYAFAKTDPGWKELEEEYDDHPEIGPIIAARVAAKSTLAVSRSARLLEIAKTRDWFRVPLRYYGAHTGRYSGMEKINAQNLPRIDKSRMRFGVVAPKGHVILAADLAQIEARITAWLAKQYSLINGFRNREDIYSDFATTAYGIETVKDRSPEDKKRRFVGKTCVLGLGYGMSAARLKATLRKDNVKMELMECERLVQVYRTKYAQIPKLWRTLDSYIETMATGQGWVEFGPCMIGYRHIKLPNDMALLYPHLKYHSSTKYQGWTYTYSNETRTLWGGKLTENIVQALARIIVMDNMLEIRKSLQLRPALQQHDELDYVVPEGDAERYAVEIGKIMRRAPLWAPDLPVEVEINYGPTLGHCK